MLLPTQDKEARLTDKEILDTIRADKHRIYNVSVTITRRDYLIALAQIAKLEKLGYYKGLPTIIEEAL